MDVFMRIAMALAVYAAGAAGMLLGVMVRQRAIFLRRLQDAVAIPADWSSSFETNWAKVSKPRAKAPSDSERENVPLRNEPVDSPKLVEFS
jgi:hypothetical protein